MSGSRHLPRVASPSFANEIGLRIAAPLPINSIRTQGCAGDGWRRRPFPLRGRGQERPRRPFHLKADNTPVDDGSEIAAAIILHNADASASDVEIVNLKRRAQVVVQNLIWPAGITADQQKTALDQLAALGIIARMGV